MLRVKFFLASLLYKYQFPLYHFLYFRFKKKQDAFIISLAEKIIRPGFTVIDIGANIGFFSSFFSKLVGEKGRVISFEPDKTNFHHLREEVKSCSNVTIEQKAVSSGNGELTLYVSSMINVDHRTYKPEQFKYSYPVKKIMLDDYFTVGEKIDFIKMDIQGAETDALKGMRRLLGENEKLILISEIWPYGLKEAGSGAAEMIGFLESLGFNVAFIEHNRIVPPDPALITRNENKPEIYFNAIFTRLSLMELKKKMYGS